MFIGWPKRPNFNCANILKIFQTMVFLNSALNPILYSLLNQSFMARFKLSFKNMEDKMMRRESTNFSSSRRQSISEENSRLSPPINQYTRKLSIFNDPFMTMRSRETSETSDYLNQFKNSRRESMQGWQKI